MVAQPALPIEGRRFVRLDVELHAERSDVQHPRPRDAVARLFADVDAAAQAEEPIPQPRMEAARQDDEAHLDGYDPWRLALAQLEDEAVHPPHLRLLAIGHLRIEDVADQVQAFHQPPPRKTSGIVTTASTIESTSRKAATVFEIQPLACSLSSLRSFMMSRKGMATNGSTKALIAIVNSVSFSGSIPNKMSSDEMKMAPV